MELEIFRPGVTQSLEDYILECHNRGFAGLCRDCFHFTDEELKTEHRMWMDYIMTHTPDPYPGIASVIHRQKEEGGLVCVVSHSHADNIVRDYKTHFNMVPDAIYGWELPPHQRKPQPYPLLDIMQRYDLKPEEILVVDDMKLACQMADPLGITVAYSGWNGLGIPEIEAEMKAMCAYSFDSTEKLYNFLFD
jgi:phosphoglycolate phosphatase/pyrophosphatase PpaX